MAGPRIDLAALERRAQAAQIAVVEHARPTGVVPAPAGLQDVPHDLASSRDFLAAKTAVERWSAATALYQRANALYHHPAIRQAAGDEATLRWFAGSSGGGPAISGGGVGRGADAGAVPRRASAPEGAGQAPVPARGRLRRGR
jgi:hypothetical protein